MGLYRKKTVGVESCVQSLIDTETNNKREIQRELKQAFESKYKTEEFKMSLTGTKNESRKMENSGNTRSSEYRLW